VALRTQKIAGGAQSKLNKMYAINPPIVWACPEESADIPEWAPY